MQCLLKSSAASFCGILGKTFDMNWRNLLVGGNIKYHSKLQKTKTSNLMKEFYRICNEMYVLKFSLLKKGSNIQHKNYQHNNTQQNDTQNNNTQYNSTQCNGTLHNNQKMLILA